MKVIVSIWISASKQAILFKFNLTKASIVVDILVILTIAETGDG